MYTDVKVCNLQARKIRAKIMEVSRNRTRKPKRKLVADVLEEIIKPGMMGLGRLGNIKLVLM